MRLKEDSIAADRKVAQLAPALSRMEAQEAEARSELAELDIIIGEKETRLFILSDELITFNKEMNQLAKIFDEKRDEIKRIATQRARTCQFRSAGERDKWIRKEIQVMQNTLEGNKKHLESLNEEAHSLRIRLEDLSKAERENSNISDPSKDKKSIRVLQEERRELWRTENKLTASLVTVRQQLLSSEKTLAAAGDGGRSVAALSAVRRLANSMNLGDKVYGALYELITPRDSVLNAAIDAAAGSALMHCIVDNAQTAALLMEALSKEKSGRLTFCPLDRLSDNYRENEFKEAGDYLENNFMIDDEKAVKLIDQIDFDESVRPAIEAVFGRILVIRDLSDAAVARAAGWTCVTVDGDRADRSGAISSSGTGSHGRMEAAARYTHWSRKTVEHETLLKQVKNRLSEVDRLLASSISSAVQKTDEQSQTTIFEEVKLSLDAKEAAILSLSNDSLSIEREIKSLESEIGTLLGEAMSEINLTIDDSELVLMAQKVREIKAEMAEIESQLEEKLRRRKRHLVRWLLDGPDEVRQEYQEALEKVETSKAALKIAEAESLRLSETRSKAEQESLLISQALDLARSAHDEALKHKLHSSGPKERILAKRTALIAEREALVRRIAAIPLDFIVLNSNCNTMTISNEAEESEEVSEIAEDLPEETLLKLLHQVNDRIKKECQHVNKKAYEQHAAFERQGNLLEKRKDELEKSASSINDFIGVLDRRKDEAIERTFSTVATAFSEIFAALTSGGSGELLIMRDFVSTDSTDIDDEITCDEKSDKNQTSKEARGKRGTKKNLQVQKQRITYTGISVRVSFSSKEGTLLTQQLSGGQKSLVALALIFAIQRCDPAPFYLFDEIDANLDAAHRTAVANLIHKMCSAGVDSSISLSSQDEESVCERIETAQFITTTFRPELLTNANAFFGVSFGGRVSRVESISREQALHFVEQDPVAC